jgi:hypothetical protein
MSGAEKLAFTLTRRGRKIAHRSPVNAEASRDLALIKSPLDEGL